MRKGKRRSSAGIGREASDSLPGLTIEWNQKGATMNDPKLLTRLLQKKKLLHDEDDYLAEGKKVLPVDALSSAYKKFLMPDNSKESRYCLSSGQPWFSGHGRPVVLYESASHARHVPFEQRVSHIRVNRRRESVSS